MKQIKGFIIVLTFIVAILISNDWQGKSELDQVQFEHDYTVEWEASDFSTVSPTTLDTDAIRYLFNYKGSIDRGKYLFNAEDSEVAAIQIYAAINWAYVESFNHVYAESEHTSMHYEYAKVMEKMLREVKVLMNLYVDGSTNYNGENLLITIY